MRLSRRDRAQKHRYLMGLNSLVFRLAFELPQVALPNAEVKIMRVADKKHLPADEILSKVSDILAKIHQNCGLTMA